MGKAVISTDYGGDGLSKAAIALARKMDPSIDWAHLDDLEEKLPAHNATYVAVVEKLGKKASHQGKLRVEEFPGNLYYIIEFDGMETLITPSDMYDVTKE